LYTLRGTVSAFSRNFLCIFIFSIIL
jgi:hypothetical protein